MIFNKNGNGASEIKGMIGWIYKSNVFENLVTYLKIAERDLLRIVGPEIYKYANDHYNGDHYEQEEPAEDAIDYSLQDELVHLMQLPMALIAYRRYAPGVDLQHSEAGRRITVTNELKPAFEWMIERDNKNILSLAHEAIDMLLEFLDVQLIPVSIPAEEEGGEPTESVNDIGDTWGSSLAYSQTKSLFINTTLEFDRVYPINMSRHLYMTISPFIREVENRHIVPIILSTRYDSIREKLKDGDLQDEDKKILELARVPIALLTMSIAMKRLSIEVLPDSVVQNYAAIDAKQSHTADSADRRGLATLLESDGRRELIPLQNYIASLTPVVETPEVPTNCRKPFFLA